MNRFLPIVGVMGSGKDPCEDLAAPLGRFLSTKPVHILTGSGQGVMTSVSKAFCENDARKGLCLGVVPSTEVNGDFVAMPGYPNPYVELAVHSPLGVFGGEDPKHISRNHINIMTSHAVIALPGSIGTQNEVAIALWLKKPIILFGPSARFDLLPPQVERTEDLDRIDSFLNDVLAFESKVAE